MTRPGKRPCLFLAVLALAASAWTTAAELPQQVRPSDPSAGDPWFTPMAKSDFTSVKPANVPFEFQIPKKDWIVVVGAGPGAEMQMVAISKKGEGTVLFERTIMRQALEPSDITDLFLQLETNTLTERQPAGSGFESRILEGRGLRIVGIQFTRPGMAGAERARQYSIPIGRNLYRLTCAAPAAVFEKFAPVCAHIAFSFIARD